MEFGSFCVGSLVGAVYGAVIVYLLWQMEVIRKKVVAEHNPYDKFPDALQPNLTAAGVSRSSRIARVTYAFVVIFLGVFVVSFPVLVYLLLA